MAYSALAITLIAEGAFCAYMCTREGCADNDTHDTLRPCRPAKSEGESK